MTISQEYSVQSVFAGASRSFLHHGESLAFLQSLPDGSVDAIITDPPYSSGGQYRGDRTNDTTSKYVQSGTKVERQDFAGDNRDQRAFAYWMTLWISECLRVSKTGSPICLFTDWRQLPTMTDALQAGGFVWRGIVPWDKTEGVRPSMGRFASQCEYVVWGSAGAMPLREDVGCLCGLVRASVKQADKHHITGKPTEVMQFVARVCPPGGIVLDPFAGSATTGVGALLEGRRFIGCEIGEAYAGVSRERLAAAEHGVSLEAHRAGQVPLFGKGAA